MKGFFLTIEGVDGAGKSSHLECISSCFKAHRYAIVTTREPGGTPLAERLREILLSQNMSLETELLLMFAARQEHINQLIKPALSAGRAVICDRFTDSSFAYQGGGRQMSHQKIQSLVDLVHPELEPDLTLLFDLPLEIARARMLRERQLDRFEQEQADFFERVRAAYLKRANDDPERFVIIDSSQPKERVAKRVCQAINDRLKIHLQQS
ncbi:Thymidylate kinase [Oligella ureolytica]|uniref:dTMP kinase n=1 Tax=Oligella ureolytica TaxID=90244 RepID=UPI000E06ED12|nr:dTMP kinase [Oligella ureolytica]SUA51450.1 Thymidylate kinase [Oligella ureolytica]